MGKILWVLVFLTVLVLWGGTKNIQPDLSQDGGYEPCKVSSHPLWQEC